MRRQRKALMSDIRSIVGSGRLVAFAQELNSLSHQGEQGRKIAGQIVDTLGAAIEARMADTQEEQAEAEEESAHWEEEARTEQDGQGE